MTKCLFLLGLLCALVAVNHAQDMTAMFQLMGMEAPLMPPTMPKSLQQALYPKTQQQTNRQRLLQQYRMRLAAARAAQQQKQQQQQQQGQQRGPQQHSYQQYQKPLANQNPYSVSYRTSIRSQPSGQNSVFSPANRIRRPGSVNAIAPSANPYSKSRASESRIPSVRYQAMAARRPRLPPKRHPGASFVKTFKTIQSTPKKIREAQLNGCTMPDGPEALMMAGRCRSQAAQMICQTRMMSCLDVGYTSMCCPLGMNRLAMDTLTYVKKLNQFMAEIA